MNSTIKALPPLLDFLRDLMPPSHIVLVGAGNGKGGWAQWLSTVGGPSTLVEADAQQFAALQRMQAAGSFSDARLLHAVVTAEAGEAAFYSCSLAAESGLLPAESVQHLWPNAHTLQANQRHATALADLLVQQHANQWLVLDCLPAATFFKTAVSAQSQLDVLVARVLLTENKAYQIQGAGLTELIGLLPEFSLLALNPSRHPEIAYALFVRDYRRATAHALKAKMAEQASKQAAVDAQKVVQAQLKQAQERLEQERILQLKKLDENILKEKNSFKKEIEKYRGLLNFLVRNEILSFHNSNVTDLDFFDSIKIKDILGENVFSCSLINCDDNQFIFFHVLDDYIPKVMTESQDFYEKSFLQIMGHLYQAGSIIVDCGANIGNHTVFFSSILDAEVIAFEPQPTNFSLLRNNVIINGISHKVRTINKGVGDKKEILRLYQAKKNNFGTFTYDKGLIDGENLDDIKYFDMEVIRMDDELSDIKNKISVIKIDIEGMELSALKGASELIEKHLPAISVECFRKTILDEVKEFLAKYGYFIFASENSTPTFIFLNKKNVLHSDLVLKKLELLSLDKYKDKKSFNVS